MYDDPARERFYYDEKDDPIFITFSIADSQAESGYREITVGPEYLVEDSFEIEEGIMSSDSLTFQNCLSSYVKFATMNLEYVLMGMWIKVWKEITFNGAERHIPLGTFKVVSDNISRDGKAQEIIAYDALYDVINLNQEDVKLLYDEIYRSVYPTTIKNIRDYFFAAFDIEQDNSILINDDIVIPKQLSEDELVDGATIVRCIAELNGVFPHIGKDGILHWISLDVGDITEEPLYPGFYPSDETYPGDGYSGIYVDIYQYQYVKDSLIWATYAAQYPDGVQIRDRNNQVGYFANASTSENPYVVINNFMCYDLSTGQYQTIAERLYEQIRYISYIPFEMSKMYDPCIEPGDRVTIYTEEGIRFISYMFTRRSTGTRGAFETVQTKGTQKLTWYDTSSNNDKKLKNLDNRVGNLEKSGSGPLQIVSVTALPANPQLNVLYLIQGDVLVTG